MTGLPLHADRLLLRDFVEDDWRAVHEYDAHAEVVHFMTWGPNSEQDTRNFVGRNIAASRAQPRTVYELAVVERDSDRLVGGVGLSVIPQHRKGLLGYCFRRDVWGQGYATEAAGALLRFGFEELALHRVMSTCDVDNCASIRVLEKLGMQREGMLRHDALLRDGSWRDHLVFGVLHSEWRTPC